MDAAWTSETVTVSISDDGPGFARIFCLSWASHAARDDQGEIARSKGRRGFRPRSGPFHRQNASRAVRRPGENRQQGIAQGGASIVVEWPRAAFEVAAMAASEQSQRAAGGTATP